MSGTGILASACQILAHGDQGSARALLTTQLSFVPITLTKRAYSDVQALTVFPRDGFVCDEGGRMNVDKWKDDRETTVVNSRFERFQQGSEIEWTRTRFAQEPRQASGANWSAGTAVLLAGLCFSALPANAATVSVDCDAGNTITAALGNVRPGDTVLVSGTCNEQVSFNPELVRITLDGQKKTTIQHPGKGAASPHTVFIKGNDIFIKGVTVIGGLDGIHLSGPASAEIDGAVVMKTARAGDPYRQGQHCADSQHHGPG